MDKSKTLLKPRKMVKGEVFGEFNFTICSILKKYTENFNGLRKKNDC